MKQVLGVIIIVASLILALYGGVFWAFIGGLRDLIDAFKYDGSTDQILYGFIKVFFASTIGWVIAFFGFLCGGTLIASDQ